jgi:hypothetical protein
MYHVYITVWENKMTDRKNVVALNAGTTKPETIKVVVEVDGPAGAPNLDLSFTLDQVKAMTRDEKMKLIVTG